MSTHVKTSKFDHWPAVTGGGLGCANAGVAVNTGTGGSKRFEIRRTRIWAISGAELYAAM